jgi:hypothetical protein
MQVYTIYSILFIVFIILIIVTAFITVALTYFQLAVEDHRCEPHLSQHHNNSYTQKSGSAPGVSSVNRAVGLGYVA